MKIEYLDGELSKEKKDIISIKKEEIAPFTPDIVRRNAGQFAHDAFFLDSTYDWIIIKDTLGSLCLIPLKKKGD